MIDRVIVTGSRIWPSATAIAHALRTLDPQLVIHGNARGADQMAHQWALANERDFHGFNAKWKTGKFGVRSGLGYDPGAGHNRNGRMLDAYPNALVLAFPYGMAKGTRDCINQALEKGHEVRVFDLKGEWERADLMEAETSSTQSSEES